MRSDLKAVENCQLPSPPLGVQQGGVQIPAPWRGNWRLKLICVQSHLLRRPRARQFGHAAESGDAESV